MVRDIDCEFLLHGSLGEPLKDPAYFRQVRVDDELRTIVGQMDSTQRQNASTATTVQPAPSPAHRGAPRRRTDALPPLGSYAVDANASRRHGSERPDPTSNTVAPTLAPVTAPPSPKRSS